MPQRDELVAEAGELLALYRQIGNETTAPNDLAGIGVALGRALEELDLRETQDTLDSAARQLATVRAMLERVREALDR